MWWSYILAAIGVTGIYFVGRKTVWAWLLLLFNECLWIVYARERGATNGCVMATR